MKYHITHERNGIYHGILVDSPSVQIAENYFVSKHPDSRVCGIHEASMDDMKPGKPLLIVPDGWTPEPVNGSPSLTEIIKQAEVKAAGQTHQTHGKDITNSFEK